MQSLASEHLQELENLVGSKRQRQEDIIKATLGSLYIGELLYSLAGHMALTRPHSGGSDTVSAPE